MWLQSLESSSPGDIVTRPDASDVLRNCSSQKSAVVGDRRRLSKTARLRSGPPLAPPVSQMPPADAALRRSGVSAVQCSNGIASSPPQATIVSADGPTPVAPAADGLPRTLVGANAWTNLGPDWPWIVDFKYPDGPYRIGDERTSQVQWCDVTNTWIAHSVTVVEGIFWDFLAFHEYSAELSIRIRESAHMISL